MLVLYAVWWHSWPHIDITPFSRSVTCTFLALPFFTAKMYFWMGYQLFFQSRPLWNLSVWSGCAYIIGICNTKVDSWKMIIWPSKSLIWMLWYTWVFPTNFTEESKQVRYCNNMNRDELESTWNRMLKNEICSIGLNPSVICYIQQYLSYCILVSI